MSGDTFLSRWAKRKAAVRQGLVAQTPTVALPAVHPHPDLPPSRGKGEVIPSPRVSQETPEGSRGEGQGGREIAANKTTTPPPTLEEAAALTPQSDFTRFVAPDVDPAVKNAALKKLFADPQFNVMDGLDTYIDDYGKPDPIPAQMLRTMLKAHVVGLLNDERETPPPHDQDAAVRLQPHDAPEPADAPAPDSSTEQDAGRER